ncbi:hypothetical protein BDA96_01G274800 [Sorghum bicolor]|uniref:Uncharacterized protein n=1 Tax=Sorghum bicolor TaxID=4558 RepID=A0A921S047_SORBI|nr:hypothetical protein BDA96_01G274800 [Sorghum bicolor]
MPPLCRMQAAVQQQDQWVTTVGPSSKCDRRRTIGSGTTKLRSTSITASTISHTRHLHHGYMKLELTKQPPHVFTCKFWKSLHKFQKPESIVVSNFLV